MKSALEVLRKYRNKNSNLIDDYYKKKKLGIKIENYSSLFYVMEDETSKAYLNPHLHLVVIINNDGYIDNLFDKLIEFFKDYCTEYLKEDVSRAEWDYDDYFRSVYNQIKDLTVYWGI